MNKYYAKKIRHLGWVGFWQTSINFKNIFRFHFSFLREISFCLAFGGFVFPDKLGGKFQDLFCFSFNQYEVNGMPGNKFHFFFQIFYLPPIRFIIGAINQQKQTNE